MAFTEQAIAEQEKAFADIKNEYAHLTAQLEAMLKEGGLSPEDLRQALQAPQSPEVQAYMEKARETALRMGQARAAQVVAPGGKVSAAGRGRPGVVRL